MRGIFKSNRVFLVMGVALVAWTFSAGPAAAQLTGLVSWQGKPMIGARVRLVEAGLETLTDGAGRYSLNAPTRLLSDPRAETTPGSEAASRPIDARGRLLLRMDGAYPRGIRFAAPSARASSAYPLAKPAAPGNAPWTLEVTHRGYRDKAVTLPASTAGQDVSLEKDGRRHLWIWGNTTATSEAERDALFAFALKKGVGTLYLDCAGLLRNNRPALIQFLNAAKAKGLAVELLFGAPQWALPENHAVPVDLARQTADLLKTLKAQGGAYPTSIQMDVEPYSLPAWETGRDAVATGLLDMYVKLKEVLAGTPVGVTACIPRWFDGISLARGGRTRLLSDWLAEYTDRLTLMDYVDHADGIIAGAEHEIAHADSTGKEVVIGVETIAGLDPESVTFAEEGETAMEAALARTLGVYGTRPSYFGIAIHHWGSYPGLKP